MAAAGKAQTTVDRFVWALGLIVVVVYALVPIVWMASLSLKPADKLNDGKFLPSDPTFDNYRNIFKDDQFKSALVNSIGIALIATVLAVVLAMFAAYAIVRLDFPGKTLVLSGALAIAMFPPVSIIGPLFNMWRSLHLFDTWPGLIIPYMTFTLPLAIWTLSAFFREIPWDLDKAARVDGATPFQAFRKVIAPLAAPGRLHLGDPRVHLRLERLPVRDVAHLDGPGPDRARRARVLHRELAVRLPGRLDRRGVDRRHDPDHHHGAGVPAPHRRRPHLRRGEGLEEDTWPRSCSRSWSSGTPTASRR